jgi:hypothetical protein
VGTETTPRGVSGGVDVDLLVEMTCLVGETWLYDLFVHV